MENPDSVIIIMAGGLGKRMNSDLPKVLHKIKGKPMILHILEKSIELNVNKIIIVVGKHYNVIKETLIKGLHPKYLSSAEKEIMIEHEGGGWYDKWALFNE